MSSFGWGVLSRPKGLVKGSPYIEGGGLGGFFSYQLFIIRSGPQSSRRANSNPKVYGSNVFARSAIDMGADD